MYGFPDGSDDWESACHAEDLGLTPGWGKSPGEGNGNPLPDSCLENSTDRGNWRATAHALLQGIFPTQESNRDLLNCRQILYQLSYQGSPGHHKVKVKSLSCVWIFVTPWTVTYQCSPSMGFSRQEYWTGLPFPTPGDLPDPEIEPASPARWATWEARISIKKRKKRKRNYWVGLT